MIHAQNNFSKIAHSAVLLGMAKRVQTVGTRAIAAAVCALSPAAMLESNFASPSVGKTNNYRHRTRHILLS
jgi:hypothetical protein